jgi:hypothetical protein
MKSTSVKKTWLLIKQQRLGLFSSKIADCARMCFSSAHNRRSARTGRRPRKRGRCSSSYPPTSAEVGDRALRAPRANPVFSTDEKRIREENTVIDKSNDGLVCFHPNRDAAA